MVTGLFKKKAARQLGKWHPVRMTISRVKVARSFDSGSTITTGKLSLPLASAQDDGFFERELFGMVSSYPDHQKILNCRDVKKLGFESPWRADKPMR